MELKIQLQCSRQSATGLYPKPDVSNSYLTILSHYDLF
jgi:hypothetical protein